MIFTINTTSWRSPNHNDRFGPIESLVIHSCEGQWPSPRVSSLPWLCKPESPSHPDPVSCHYYVCRNAEIFQLVDDDQVAWHAGNALPRFDNASSIGIECEHRSGQNWPVEQRAALAWLCRRLMTLYRLPSSAVETHGQIAIKGPYKRKIDPTNWPYEDFVIWRARLGVHTVTAGPHGAIAQEDRRPGALAARYYPPGTPIVCDDLSGSYWHAADHSGFIPVGQVQA